MSVPAFRNSKSKVRRRRSHHALKTVQVQHDENGNVTLPHRQMGVAEVVAPKAAPAKKEKVKAEAEAPVEAKKETKDA